MRFYDVIGYGEPVEVSQGVWDDVITEVQYYGDVIRNARRFDDSQRVIGDLTVSNSISIMADAYANEHFVAIRYVRWLGTLWTVDSVEVQRPRLILRLGGVYNGPTATAPSSP